MLALDPDVVDAVWQAFAAYLPERGENNHPLGCHRPRISDRDCFEAILFPAGHRVQLGRGRTPGQRGRDHASTPS
jgi:hypothetical protein